MHNNIGVFHLGRFYLQRFCLRWRKKTSFFPVKASGALYNAILIVNWSQPVAKRLCFAAGLDPCHP
ncbi:hypothetical protein [Methylophilus luteus]|uniref:Uncharacterized protein n=1 Tax=Methylophilus luteus TaxID=640108 RepID=A0ABW3F8E3_9PROT